MRDVLDDAPMQDGAITVRPTLVRAAEEKTETCDRPCAACGLVQPHESLTLFSASVVWRCLTPHRAPCGAKCLGGGIGKATRSDLRNAHQQHRCDLCGGGREPTIAPPVRRPPAETTAAPRTNLAPIVEGLRRKNSELVAAAHHEIALLRDVVSVAMDVAAELEVSSRVRLSTERRLRSALAACRTGGVEAPIGRSHDEVAG